MTRKELQRAAMSRGIRATQSNKELRLALRADPSRRALLIGQRVVRPGETVPGTVAGLGDGSVFVKWVGYRVTEVSYGRDGSYAVEPAARGADVAK